MHLEVRAALPDDGATLARLLDAAYGGGYSATFDRDGLPQPNDLWWAQSEKDVAIIDVDRKPAGMIVVGHGRGQWLVEELLMPSFSETAPRAQNDVLDRVRAHLVERFRRGRQRAVVVRAAETNAFGLAVARRLDAVLNDALLVYRYHGAKRPTSKAPDGYEIRRTTPADARVVSRLVRDVIDDRARAEDIDRTVASKDGRAFIATKQNVAVGFGAVETRSGRGDWVVGVRDSHRRVGVGRALAAGALAALSTRPAAPFATVWALDPVAGAFLRALGFRVERTFLYLEHLL
jgi:ribosomal protein S18 acetylase RimI-like enzyme